MAGQQVRAALGRLHRLIGQPGPAAPTDAQLLGEFVARRDEKAFEILVWRHAAMVIGVCRRVLRDPHAAEDAFQAAFLVFARKAGSIGRRESVGGWLYKVAYRVALRARSVAARRRAREEPLADVPGREPPDEADWRDLRPVLDEEIGRLPERYRVPFVLCYLEGRTNEEAAEQLGCPKGTVLSRLSRGREWLRARLARRGVALSTAALLTILPAGTVSASVPAAIVSSTVGAAIPFAAGRAAAGLVPPSVATLTEGVLHAMILTKLKLAAALVALAVVTTGAGLAAQRALVEQPVPGRHAGEPEVAAAPAADRLGAVEEAAPADEFAATEAAGLPDDPPRRDRGDGKPPDAAGKVVSVSKDGKLLAVEVMSRNRGEEPKKIEVTIGDKTAVTYFGVGPNGAKPTEGYIATVRMEDAGKGLAASVSFAGPEGGRTPDVAGAVAAVAKDGKGITVETSGRVRGEEPKRTDIRFDDKTVLAFSGVAKDGAKITEGYTAQVFLADGPKGNTAGVVHFAGPELGGRRGDPAPDAVGKVAAVAADGKTITLEVPAAVRGEEPTKVVVKLGGQAAVSYFNVGPDKAKISEGMQARVWLEGGSKDTAARVVLTGTVPERWATVTGKVVGVSKDGATITLEQPPVARGEGPTRVAIKLAETRVAYTGVGPGEAKPTEGYFAQVRLVDGSKDTAAQVLFMKGGGDGRR